MSVTGTKQVQAYDTRDDRREVFGLLKRLSPARRVTFLSWCCTQATVRHSQVRPRVAAKTVELAGRARWDSGADERLLWDVWLDLWMLANNYSFSLDRGLTRLVEMVREGK